MSTIVYRPWDTWTDAATEQRLGSPFSSTYAQTLDLLCGEVDRINRPMVDAEVVIEVNAPPSRISRWGSLHAQARIDAPGVIVSFGSMHGPLRYACDTFDQGVSRQPAWQQNVRAIALALEALRKVSRYGVGARGEQYTGWGQLGTGRAMPAPMDRAAAARILRSAAGVDGHDSRSVVDLYRIAAKRTHPDHGGDTAHFAELTAAYQILTTKEHA